MTLQTDIQRHGRVPQIVKKGDLQSGYCLTRSAAATAPGKGRSHRIVRDRSDDHDAGGKGNQRTAQPGASREATRRDVILLTGLDCRFSHSNLSVMNGIYATAVIREFSITA